MGGYPPHLTSSLMHRIAERIRVSSKAPQFGAADRVRERFLFGKQRRETGIVIQIYELVGQYRYKVRFDDSREEIYFERELFPVSPAE